jgi:hypothetical protein
MEIDHHQAIFIFGLDDGVIVSRSSLSAFMTMQRYAFFDAFVLRY